MKTGEFLKRQIVSERRVLNEEINIEEECKNWIRKLNSGKVSWNWMVM